MARFRGLSWSMQQRISSVGSLRVSAVTIWNRYGLWVQTLISFSSKQNHHKIALKKIAFEFRKWMDIDGYWMFIPKKTSNIIGSSNIQHPLVLCYLSSSPIGYGASLVPNIPIPCGVDQESSKRRRWLFCSDQQRSAGYVWNGKFARGMMENIEKYRKDRRR